MVTLQHFAHFVRRNGVGQHLSLIHILAKNATVTVCHSHTANLKEICANADILVAAVGRAGFVTGDMVKPGAVDVYKRQEQRRN